MFEELAQTGVKTIIRVRHLRRTVRGYRRRRPGHRHGGRARRRRDRQLRAGAVPLVQTPEVVLALQGARRPSGIPGTGGSSWTKALFFPGVLPLPYEAYLKANIIAVEMSCRRCSSWRACAGLYAGGLLVADGNPGKAQRKRNTIPIARL